MATLSITVTAGQAARALTGVGRWLGLGRDATTAEVEDLILKHIKHIVLTTERIAASASVPDDFDNV